jgi:hypothetical protein
VTAPTQSAKRYELLLHPVLGLAGGGGILEVGNNITTIKIVRRKFYERTLRALTLRGIKVKRDW